MTPLTEATSFVTHLCARCGRRRRARAGDRQRCNGGHRVALQHEWSWMTTDVRVATTERQDRRINLLAEGATGVVVTAYPAIAMRFRFAEGTVGVRQGDDRRTWFVTPDGTLYTPGGTQCPD